MRAIDVANKADQVERDALLKKYAEVSDGLADEIISGEIEDLMVVDDGQSEPGHWSNLDTYSDSMQGKIMQELQNRSILFSDIYPFELNHSRLKHKNPGSVDKIYEALLLTSLTTRRQGKNWENLVESFEKLSAWAVKRFFQCDKIWWTGASNDEKFKQLIETITKETGELEWDPDPNISGKLKKIKDAGLDFINYRRLDERVGGLFYFGQSACGQNWISKTEKDLRPRRIQRIFRMPYADPVKLFTIPYLITNDAEEMINAANNFSGLIFDRARLTRLLVQMQSEKNVKKEISNVHHLASEECN